MFSYSLLLSLLRWGGLVASRHAGRLATQGWTLRAKLQAEPRRLQKRGRPLLDYALRSRRSMPIAMPYHSNRDDPSIHINMIDLLLEKGADPNQAVHLYDGETIWCLFLISVHRYYHTSDATARLRNAWFRACRALTKAGAKFDCTFVSENFKGEEAPKLLGNDFGTEKVAILEEEMEEYRRAQDSNRASCVTI
jgi:hypothetical protein